MLNEKPQDVIALEEVADEKETRHVERQASVGEVIETRFAHLGRLEVVKVFWRAVLICMILNWAALNDGYQQQIPGNLYAVPAFIRTMANTVVDGKPAVSANILAFWQGFAEMTKTLGMFTGGPIADKVGRKPAMIGTTIILLAGSIAQITSPDWKAWLGAAMLIRLGVGLAQSILVTYISELAPFQIRGLMIGAYQLLLGVGQLISAVATQLVVDGRPNEWRPLIATEFIFTGLLCLMIWVVPESPYHLARKQNHEKAKRSLLKLYGNAPGYDVEWEYHVIRHGIESEAEFNNATSKSSFFEIFQAVNWKRTLAGCVGICSQWTSGAPIIFSYSTVFFQDAGLQDIFLVTIITYVLLIVSISFSLVACERIGRRPLLVGGTSLMFCFCIAFATCGFFETAGSEKAALAFLLLWVLCYGASSGPIGFVAAGETSTPRLRAQTTSFNLGCYGIGFVIFQWSISYMISPIAGDLGVKALYVWAGMLVPTVIILYFYYPETTGRTYWELDELYERKIPARKFKSTSTSADEAAAKNKAFMGRKVREQVEA